MENLARLFGHDEPSLNQGLSLGDTLGVVEELYRTELRAGKFEKITYQFSEDFWPMVQPHLETLKQNVYDLWPINGVLTIPKHRQLRITVVTNPEKAVRFRKT